MRQDAGTDPDSTARDHALHVPVTVPIVERRRTPMMVPRDIKAVTISGTRKTRSINPRDLAIVFRAATYVFDEDDTTWYVGGATGIDTLFLDWMIVRLQGFIHIVIPTKLEDQPRDAQRAIRNALSQLPRDVMLTELNSKAGSPEKYYVRNRFMVDRSQMLLGFPHETELSSGTGYTINYAATIGVPRMIWPVS